MDAAAADAVVHFSLKLTESELRSFLARLAEWRDAKVAADADGDDGNGEGGGDGGALFAPRSEDESKAARAWRKHARGVTYFTLIGALAARLRSIFTPSMGLIWPHAADALAALAEKTGEFSAAHGGFLAAERASMSGQGAAAGAGAATGSGKKDKKRKLSEVGGTEDGGAERGDKATRKALHARRALHEQALRATHALACVRSACVHDADGFLDEARYTAMMPAVVDAVSARDAFPSDAVYLAFVAGPVAACLAALARAVAKDVLWKPLNHRLLLLTRDAGRKAVRVGAVHVLHKLFQEVGEEYLLLLPECLPFLSELLEDDAADVTAAAGELIRYIEELSGEKLDSYLQS